MAGVMIMTVLEYAIAHMCYFDESSTNYCRGVFVILFYKHQ
ncbi:hypothetical protein SAMN05216323_10847 [Williamwhitmania taraxaci]|uniref:Uncharacterized protein n=1 Tax=Williamwhitmania taraxaci TaxID=1640674 RepID=A0A1G6S158_9BACT|nr:hypothetical protein SAMN05216323_10847 [Williamwhitmania taraxaci]